MRPIDRPANPLPLQDTVPSTSAQSQRRDTRVLRAPVRHHASHDMVTLHGTLIKQRGKLGVSLGSYFIGFKQKATRTLDQWTRHRIIQPLVCPGTAPIRVNTETGYAALQVQGRRRTLLLELDTSRFPHPTQAFVDFVRDYNPAYPFPQPARPPQPQSAVAHLRGRSTLATLKSRTGPLTQPPVIQTSRLRGSMPRQEYRTRPEAPPIPPELFARIGAQRGAKERMLERDEIAFYWEVTPNGMVVFMEHSMLAAWLDEQPAGQRDELRAALYGAVAQLQRGNGEPLCPGLLNDQGDEWQTYAFQLHGRQDHLLHCVVRPDGRVTHMNLEKGMHEAIRQQVTQQRAVRERAQTRERFDAVLDMLQQMRKQLRNPGQAPDNPRHKQPILASDNAAFTTPSGFEAYWDEALREPDVMADPWRIAEYQADDSGCVVDPWQKQDGPHHMLVEPLVLGAIRQYQPSSGIDTQQFSTLTKRLHRKDGPFVAYKYPIYEEIFRAMLGDPHLIVYRGEPRHEIECRGVLDNLNVQFRLKAEERSGNISIYGLMLSGLRQYHLSDALADVVKLDSDLATLCATLEWPHGSDRLVRLAVNPEQGIPVPGCPDEIQRFRCTIGHHTIDLCAHVTEHCLLAVTPFVADAKALQARLTYQTDTVNKQEALEGKAAEKATQRPVYAMAPEAAIHLPVMAQGDTDPDQLLRELAIHLLGHENYTRFLDTVPLESRSEEQSLAFGLGIWRVERTLQSPLHEALVPYVEMQGDKAVFYLVAEIDGLRNIERFGGQIEQLWLGGKNDAEAIFRAQCELDGTAFEQAVLHTVVVTQLRQRHQFEPLYRLAHLLLRNGAQEADDAMQSGRTEDTAIAIEDDPMLADGDDEIVADGADDAGAGEENPMEIDGSQTIDASTAEQTEQTQDDADPDARLVLDFLLHVTRDDNHAGGSDDAAVFACRFERPYDSLPAAVQDWVERADDGATVVRLQRGSFREGVHTFPRYAMTRAPLLMPVSPGNYALDRRIDLAIDHPLAGPEERHVRHTHAVLSALTVHVLGHEDYSRLLEQQAEQCLDEDPLSTRGWKIAAWRIPCDTAALPALLRPYAERSGDDDGALHLVAQLCQPHGGRALVLSLWLCSRAAAGQRMEELGRFYREELAAEAAGKSSRPAAGEAPALPAGVMRDARLRDAPKMTVCDIDGYVLGMDRLTEPGRRALSAYIGPGDDGLLGVAFAVEAGDDTLWFCTPQRLGKTVAALAENRAYKLVTAAMLGNAECAYDISLRHARKLGRQPDLRQLARQVGAVARHEGTVVDTLLCLIHPLLEVPSPGLESGVRRYRYNYLGMRIDLCARIEQDRIKEAWVMRDGLGPQAVPSSTCAWRLLGKGTPAGMQAAQAMLGQLAGCLSDSDDWRGLLTGTPERLDKRMRLYRFDSDVKFDTLPGGLRDFVDLQADGTAGLRLLAEEEGGLLHQLAVCGADVDKQTAHGVLLAYSLLDKQDDPDAADALLDELGKRSPALRQALEEAAALAGIGGGARTLLGNVLATQAPPVRQAFEFACVLPVAWDALPAQHRPWFSVRDGRLLMVLHFVPHGEDTSGASGAYRLDNVAHDVNVGWQVAQLVQEGEEEAQQAQKGLHKYRSKLERLVSNKAPLDKAEAGLKRELGRLKTEEAVLAQREVQTAALLGGLLTQLNEIDAALAAWEVVAMDVGEAKRAPARKRVAFDEQATVRTTAMEDDRSGEGSVDEDGADEGAEVKRPRDRLVSLNDPELARDRWQRGGEYQPGDMQLQKRAARLAGEVMHGDDNGVAETQLLAELDEMQRTHDSVEAKLAQAHKDLDAHFVERLLIGKKRALVEALLPTYRGDGLRPRLAKLTQDALAQRLQLLIEKCGAVLSGYQLAKLHDWSGDALNRVRAQADRREKLLRTVGRVVENHVQAPPAGMVLAYIERYDQNAGGEIAQLAQANGMAFDKYLQHIASATPGTQVNARVPFLRSYSTGPTTPALLMRVPGGRITEARIDNDTNRRDMAYYGFPKARQHRIRIYDRHRNGGQLQRVARFTGSLVGMVKDIVRCGNEKPVDAKACPEISLYPSTWNSVVQGRKFHLLGQAKRGEIVDARLSSFENFRSMALRHPDAGWGLPEIQALMPALSKASTPSLWRFIENRVCTERKLPLNPDIPDDPEAKAYPGLGRYLAGRDRDGNAHYLLALVQRGRIVDVALDTPDNRRRMMRYKLWDGVLLHIQANDIRLRRSLQTLAEQFGYARIWQLVRATVCLENRQIVEVANEDENKPAVRWPTVARYPLPPNSDGATRYVLALVCDGGILDVQCETPQVLKHFISRARAMGEDQREYKHLLTLGALAEKLRKKASSAGSREKNRAVAREFFRGRYVKELARAHNRNWRAYVDEITATQTGEQVDGDIWRYPTGATVWDKREQRHKPAFLLVRRIPGGDDIDAPLDTPENLKLMQMLRARQQRVVSAAELDITTGLHNRAIHRCATRDMAARGFVHRLADRCDENFAVFVARVVGNGKGKRIHKEFDLRRYETGLSDGNAPICVRAHFEKDEFGNDELVELTREWPEYGDGDPVLDDGLRLLCKFLAMAPADIEYPHFMRPAPADSPAAATDSVDAAIGEAEEEALTLCGFADSFNDNACLNSILQSTHAGALLAIIDSSHPGDSIAGMRALLAATVAPGFGVPVDGETDGQEESDGLPPRMRYLCFLTGPDDTVNFIARVDSENRITEAVLDAGAGVDVPVTLPVQSDIGTDLYDLLSRFDFTAQDTSATAQDPAPDWMKLEAGPVDMPKLDAPWTEDSDDLQALFGSPMEDDLDEMPDEVPDEVPQVLQEQGMDLDTDMATQDHFSRSSEALPELARDEPALMPGAIPTTAEEIDWDGLMDELHIEIDPNAPAFSLPLTLDELLEGFDAPVANVPQGPVQEDQQHEDMILDEPIPFVPLSSTTYPDGRIYTPDPAIAPLSMNHRLQIRCIGRGGGRYPFPQEKQIGSRCAQHAINSVTVDRYDLDDPTGDAAHKPMTQAEFDWLELEPGNTAGAEAIRVMKALDKKGIRTHLVALSNLVDIEHEPFLSEILDDTAHSRQWLIPLQGQAGPGEVHGHYPVIHWDSATHRSYLVDSLNDDQPEMSLSAYLTERRGKGDDGCQLIVPDSCADALLQRDVLLDTPWVVAGLQAIDALFHTRSHVLGLGRHFIERSALVDTLSSLDTAALSALLRPAGIDALHAYLCEALGDDAVTLRQYDMTSQAATRVTRSQRQQETGSPYDRIAPNATHALVYLPGLNPMFAVIEKRGGCWHVIEADAMDASDTTGTMDTRESVPTLEAFIAERRAVRQAEIKQLPTTSRAGLQALERELRRLKVIEFRAGLDMGRAANLLQDRNRELTRAALQLAPEKRTGKGNETVPVDDVPAVPVEKSPEGEQAEATTQTTYSVESAAAAGHDVQAKGRNALTSSTIRMSESTTPKRTVYPNRNAVTSNGWKLSPDSLYRHTRKEQFATRLVKHWRAWEDVPGNRPYEKSRVRADYHLLPHIMEFCSEDRRIDDKTLPPGASAYLLRDVWKVSFKIYVLHHGMDVLDMHLGEPPTDVASGTVVGSNLAKNKILQNLVLAQGNVTGRKTIQKRNLRDYEKTRTLYTKNRVDEFRHKLVASWRKGVGNNVKKEWEILVDIDELCTKEKRVEDREMLPGVDKYRLTEWKETFDVYVCREDGKLEDIRLGAGDKQCTVKNHYMEKSEILRRMADSASTRAALRGKLRTRTSGLELSNRKAAQWFSPTSHGPRLIEFGALIEKWAEFRNEKGELENANKAALNMAFDLAARCTHENRKSVTGYDHIVEYEFSDLWEEHQFPDLWGKDFSIYVVEKDGDMLDLQLSEPRGEETIGNEYRTREEILKAMMAP